MKKIVIIATALFLGICANSYGVTTFALSNINNIAKFTGANALTTIDSTNITTATMFGGFLTNVGPAVKNLMANYQRTLWTFNFTNLGNASASFRAVIAGSNIQYGTLAANGWTHHFNTNGFNAPLGPLSGRSFSFVISNILAASNNAYVSYLIKVSNLSAYSNAHAYRGADSATWYGGNLGILTNHNRTNGVSVSLTRNPVVYLQHAPGTGGVTNQAGYLTAIISGPVLRISKTITSISNPSGLSIQAGYAVPGSYIYYKIVASNIGGGMATNTRIVDTIATQFVTYAGLIQPLTNFGLLSSIGNQLIFTNFTNRLRYGAGQNFGIVKFRVMIK